MFLLQKWITAFIYPFPLGSLMMVVGLGLWWLTKRRHALARGLITSGFVLIVLPSMLPFAQSLIRPLEQEFPAYGTTAFQTLYPQGAVAPLPVVVLGGGTLLGSELPPTARIPAVALQRVAEGIRIYRAAAGRQLIMSGGRTFGSVSEAQAMADIAESLGVPITDMRQEMDSRNTVEQAIALKKVIGDASFFLVTSASHMPRALALLQKQGMHPIPCPGGQVGTPQDAVSPGAILPNPSAAMSSQLAFHEYLGWLIGWVRGDL